MSKENGRKTLFVFYPGTSYNLECNSLMEKLYRDCKANKVGSIPVEGAPLAASFIREGDDHLHDKCYIAGIGSPSCDETETPGKLSLTGSNKKEALKALQKQKEAHIDQLNQSKNKTTNPEEAEEIAKRIAIAETSDLKAAEHLHLTGDDFPEIDGPLTRLILGQAKGVGREENVVKAATMIAHTQFEEKAPYDKIVIVSWSRGGVTAIHLANKLYELGIQTGYDLSLMLDQDKNDESLEPNKIYIRKLVSNALEYAVLGTDGKTIHRSIIASDQLSNPLKRIVESESDNPMLIEAYTPYLNEILEITSKKGHTLQTKVNIFAIDPVAGRDDGWTQMETRTLPPTAEATFIQAKGDATREFESQNRQRMIEIDKLPHEKSRIKHIPVHGTHGQVAGAQGKCEPSQITEKLLIDFLIEILGEEEVKKLFAEHYQNWAALTEEKMIALYAKTQVDESQYQYQLNPFNCPLDLLYTRQERHVNQYPEQYSAKPMIFVNDHHEALFKQTYPEIHQKLEEESLTFSDIAGIKDENSQKVLKAAMVLRPLDAQIQAVATVSTPLKLSLMELRKAAEKEIFARPEATQEDLAALPIVQHSLFAAKITAMVISPEVGLDAKQIAINEFEVIAKTAKTGREVLGKIASAAAALMMAATPAVVLKPLDLQIEQIKDVAVFKPLANSLIELRELARKEISAHPRAAEKQLKALPMVEQSLAAATMTATVVSPQFSLNAKLAAINKFKMTAAKTTQIATKVLGKIVSAAAALVLCLTYVPVCTMASALEDRGWKKGFSQSMQQVAKVSGNIHTLFTTTSKPAVLEQANAVVSLPTKF